MGSEANVTTRQRRLRLGMIGGGRGAFIGAIHRMAARLDDRYELVAGVLSSTPERARASGRDLLLDTDRCYTSLDELLAAEARRSDRIDVVAVVTPNDLHYPISRRCLDAGFHVICDKPLTNTVAEAQDLVNVADRTQQVLAVTYNYSGYPLVRQAREMMASGELGELRVIQVEYAQGWLSTKLEAEGDKQARWRTDPERAGVAGAVGDIGTHAFHLAEFVTGLRVSHIAADLSAQVPDRRLDDNANMMLRFEGGARGGLWASQVAVGLENNLRVRVFGSKAGLEWSQESPNQLRFARQGQAPLWITRGGPHAAASAIDSTRLPAGHPEGYIEAFAQIYRDIADLIAANNGHIDITRNARLVPTARDGLRGVQFIHAAIESSRRDAAWVAI